MKRSKVIRPLLAFSLFSALGCSLLVDTSDVDQGCPAGQKLCGTGHCVEQSDPAYGCSPDHCEPCSLANAIPICSQGNCVVNACLLGFGCRNDGGCPANLLIEIENCGSCGHRCDAGTSCRDGECVPS